MVRNWFCKERILVAIACTLSFVFAGIYSLCNTDSHHWGFILGTAKDAIRGDRFFSEIYIQYGVGQPFLYKIMDAFLPINYTTIGIVTAFFYIGSLLVLFNGLKRVADFKSAAIVAGAAFLMHPFSIYPWPDYYAGFFLVLGCWCLVARLSNLSGLLFFTSFLFRNTYLIGFLAAGISYAVISSVNPRVRDRKVTTSLITAFVLIAAYIVFLYLRGGLASWYGQTIGAGSTAYGMGSDQIFDLLRNAFMPTRFWLPNQLVNTTLVIMNWSMVFIALAFLFKKDVRFNWASKVSSGTLLLFALLALGGLVQGAMIYEVFRVQNASISGYFSLAILFATSIDWSAKKTKILSAVYFILMIAKLPSSSALYPIYEGRLGDYSTISIPAFGRHLARNEVKSFYESLYRELCDGKSTIINFTRDSMLGYLCGGQRNGLRLPFYFASMIANLDPENLKRVQTGDFHEDELIISGVPVVTHSECKLVTIDRLKVPEEMRPSGGGVISVYRVQRKLP